MRVVSATSELISTDCSAHTATVTASKGRRRLDDRDGASVASVAVSFPVLSQGVGGRWDGGAGGGMGRLLLLRLDDDDESIDGWGRDRSDRPISIDPPCVCFKAGVICGLRVDR